MALAVMDLEVATPVSDWDAARAGQNGLSVMCVLDVDTRIATFYDTLTIERGIDHLESLDGLVTFNGLNFDIPCLEGLLGRRMVLQNHYDILQEIWAAQDPTSSKKNTGLGPTAERTLGFGKIGDGTHAPELYQQERFAELYSYCFHDCYLTSELFSHILQYGFVIGPDGDKLCVRPYEDLIGRRSVSGETW